MNALLEIQRNHANDEAMVGIAEARRRLEEKQRQNDRDLAMIILGMCLTEARKKVLEAVSDGTGEMEVDLTLEAIRELRKSPVIEFFARRGVKIEPEPSVFQNLLKSLVSRFAGRKVSNAMRVLNLTQKGDAEALSAALEDVRKAIGKE